MVIITQCGVRVIPDAEEVDLATNLLAPLPIGVGCEREARVGFGEVRAFGLGFAMTTFDFHEDCRFRCAGTISSCLSAVVKVVVAVLWPLAENGKVLK